MKGIGTTRISFFRRLRDRDDQNGWEEFHARYGAAMYRYARKRGVSHNDAEDLVQEAFVRIWRLYGHTGDVPPTLVFRTIRRLAIDWVRREDRREIREQKVVMDNATSSPWFERQVEKMERQAIIEDAVRGLPSDLSLIHI